MFLRSQLDMSYFSTHPKVVEEEEWFRTHREVPQHSFTLEVDEPVRQSLEQEFGIPLQTSLPMRWIRGDTQPHVDRDLTGSFERTHLMYVTGNEGTLVLGEKEYPIFPSAIYSFESGTLHGTLGTGDEPRLLLGPMNERSAPVGIPPVNTIMLDPEVQSLVYIRFSEESGDIEYSFDTETWYAFVQFEPVYINNSNTMVGNVVVLFSTDITITYSNFYFVCNTSNIIYGTTADVRCTNIHVNLPSDQPYGGLIHNMWCSNIYVYNLRVIAGETTVLADDGGWIGRSQFATDGLNHYIVNCHSTGNISYNGGGIVGSSACNKYGNDTSLYIIGCSSLGSVGNNGGGIVGPNAGYLEGSTLTCVQCYSHGELGTDAGGIVGPYCAYDGSQVYIQKCFSTGTLGANSGGIVGSNSAYEGGGSPVASVISVSQSYMTGNFSSELSGNLCGTGCAGGISTIILENCYSLYLSPAYVPSVNIVQTNVYQANGSWSSATANQALSGVPISGAVGEVWVEIANDEAYELNEFGFSPYLVSNINNNALIQMYAETISSGGTSSAGQLQGMYSLLTLGGLFSIDVNTGVLTAMPSTPAGTHIMTVRFIDSFGYSITSVELTVEAGGIVNAETLVSFLNGIERIGPIQTSTLVLPLGTVLTSQPPTKTLTADEWTKMYIQDVV